MNLAAYIDKLNTRFKTGISREHSYRGDLQNLLERLAPDVLVTNEPARIACGAPDYIITKRNIPLGYIEAKDIGADLRSKTYQEQFDRYRQSLSNLIITDYLNFHLYRDGELATSLLIGEIQGHHIIGRPENYAAFTDLIKDFCTHTGQTITSALKLSQMMAGKARLLANVIEKALAPTGAENQVHEHNQTLRDQFRSFQQILIHDMTEKTFADIYAQTIAYGMFAARLHDQTLEDFSRQKAAEFIPKSNPFLRKLFQYIAGYDLDDRITWIVDALADIFRATNVAELLQDFGKATQQSDPMIHFYETFLSEYDPALRKSRGVWYTPQPVVNFIVRAVDDLLKSDFGLAQGIADTAKTRINVDVQGKKVRQDVHKVQILDPAAGTGTFLAQVVRHIYQQFEGQQGMWSNYVEEHLIPRLHGFEILMASYAMAHLKLDVLLSETGYHPQKAQRFRVFLTNSLEEHHPDTGSLFAAWLSTEANEANYIKRDTPVMVVLGNPPYSGESANKGDWIKRLMDDYKQEPGGQEKLREKNSKWINDDYVKFLRYGQYFIEKNGEGILAFINPHGFLDNPTFRGMRWNLLKTYDKIYTIDLHGNSKKKEACPDGSPDENVFDIQQGVSINLFVKTGKKRARALGQVFHYDVYGRREMKYDFLFKHSLRTIPYTVLENIAPNYFFVPKNFDVQKKYEEGFLVNELFFLNSVGIVTAKDAVLINDSKDILLRNVEDSYKIEARQDVIQKISYRPFDNKFVYYDIKVIERAREKVMQHFLKGDNIGLVFSRQSTDEIWTNIQITKHIIDNRYHFSYKGIPYQAPLYLYPENDIQQTIGRKQERTSNLNNEIVQKIAEKLRLIFTTEKEPFDSAQGDTGTFAPIDLLDYIYAVLHSPTYREKYKEFLKIDFPRVPYPKDANTFWRLVELGGELRQIHLLESPIVEQRITTYPQPGENMVKTPRFDHGRVWINETQYFDHVPQTAWEFYIGGYQPAQKWLKDRKGRTLNFEDLRHYQKIIVALAETDRIMQKIDDIDLQ